jgi:DNA-binding NarL/FixJ family response regulator
MDRTTRHKNTALARTVDATRQVRVAVTEQETAVARAMHWGATWAEIAAALGVTPQAAHKRFRRLRYDPASGRAWHEPPLPM